MRLTPDHRQINRAGGSPAAPSASFRFRTMPLRMLASAALLVLMSACTPGSTTEPAGSATGNEEPAVQTAPAGDSGAGGQALADTSAKPSANPEAVATEEVKETVTTVLTQLAAAAPKPATAQVTDALTGAGIAPGVLQVSQSRTPTGLEADAIEAAVLQGKDCVIGQVREGTVTVTVLPVLANGKCFVGS
ncbi:DUF6993 domain-containing protein [Arthrobacter nitrophenolicus]|uniref:DUF6993 domain-containing protein n=1 Tax=Arthrobacter nitrophenolicus TaxID=683150 RepID=UPI00389B00B7